MRVRLQPFELALKRPLRTARHVHHVRRGIRIHVEHEGVTGVGECTPLPEFGTEDLAVAHDQLARTLPAPAWTTEDVQRSCALISTPAARHGMEQALLDLASRRAGVPLHRWLDANARNEVPVHVLLDGCSPDAVAVSARAAVANGFHILKLKAGFVDDVERIRAAREAVPADVRIRLDTNGAWSVMEATTSLQRLADFNVELCEQPIPAGDVAALSVVAARSPIPIAADESLADADEREALINQRAVGILVLKPMVLGGLLTSLDVARRAHRVAIHCLVTSALDGVVARAGAAQLAAALPGAPLAAGLAVGHLFVDDDVDPFTPHDGVIRLGGAPGLGLEVPWSAC